MKPLSSIATRAACLQLRSPEWAPQRRGTPFKRRCRLIRGSRRWYARRARAGARAHARKLAARSLRAHCHPAVNASHRCRGRAPRDLQHSACAVAPRLRALPANLRRVERWRRTVAGKCDAPLFHPSWPCAVCLPRASPPLSCSARRVRTLRRGDSQLAQFAGRRQDTRCAPNWSEHLEWPPPHSRSKTRRWARSNKAHPMPGLQAPAPSLLQVTRINPLTRHFDSTLSLDTLVGSTTL